MSGEGASKDANDGQSTGGDNEDAGNDESNDEGQPPPTGGEKTKESPKIDLPLQVQALFARHRRLGLLFHGKAKGFGADGQPLGTEQSFDRELMIALAIKGVTSASTLAAVLRARPKGYAASQGDEAIAELIADVLGVVSRPRAPRPSSQIALPFTVGRVTRFNADPPTYTVEINGVEIEMTSAQLFKLTEFKQRCFDRLHAVLALPSGRGAQAMWETMVPQITRRAIGVTPSADGTRRGALEIAIRKAIEDLPLGDSLADLRDGRGMIANYRRRDVLLFTTDAIIAQLVRHDTMPTREEIAQLLPRLGCEKHRYKLPAGKRTEKLECWRTTPRTRPNAAASASTSVGAAPSFEQPPPSAQPDDKHDDKNDDKDDDKDDDKNDDKSDDKSDDEQHQRDDEIH